MKYLKTFENYSASESEPTTKPTTKPATKPGKAPSRPSPIRRDRPSEEPAPKALGKEDKEKKLLKKRYRPSKATAEEVVERYLEESGDHK